MAFSNDNKAWYRSIVNSGTEEPGKRQAKPGLSLVIPMYNEAERVDSTLSAVSRYLQEQPYESEIIAVNDGSDDDTLARLSKRAEQIACLRVIDAPHAGKAAAVRAGVFAASCELIAFSDADLATPIYYLEPFRDAIASGADVVIGSREGAGASRIGEPGFRHIMGRVFNGLVRGLVLPGIQDTQCGFKMFTRQAALDLFGASRLYGPGTISANGPRVTAFDVELLVIARRRHYRVEIIPVSWTFGENSKVRPTADTVNNLRDVLTVKLHDLRGLYD